jgi:hypothetical protein
MDRKSIAETAPPARTKLRTLALDARVVTSTTDNPEHDPKQTDPLTE